MHKDAEREELACAIAQFLAGGGQIEESQILARREDKLRRDMRQFDRAREAAVSKGKRDEQAARPDYLRSVCAMKHKT